MPDRIILGITETPSVSQVVNWRTSAAVDFTVAQIVPAKHSVGLHLQARQVQGESVDLTGENGLARHHRVEFSGLQPDTLYAYRVAGRDTWSEWFQFRTAPDRPGEFSFLYFGDAQNSVKSHFSRVIREARLDLPRPALMLHAGDLVNLRDGNHDDEWGEWFEAGAFLYAMTPNIVVAGNHEHLNLHDANDERVRVLSEHFRHQFSLPANGVGELQDTTGFVRYGDVLFVVLDSTQALEKESLARAQAGWLDALLSRDDSRWVIITHHHPIHSVSLGRDNPELREHFQTVYRRHPVDLVLQGHDHTYGRGHNLTSGTTAIDNKHGTVYMVSVSGPKMYLISDETRMTDRQGEDLQLYQMIDVAHDRLRIEARTVTGETYDAFEIERQEDGSNRVIELERSDIPQARCSNPDPRRDTRCWEGFELVEPAAAPLE